MHPFVAQIISIYFGHEAHLLQLSSGGAERVPCRIVEGLKSFDYYYRRAQSERDKLERVETTERIEKERKEALARARSGRP